MPVKLDCDYTVNRLKTVVKLHVKLLVYDHASYTATQSPC